MQTTDRERLKFWADVFNTMWGDIYYLTRDQTTNIDVATVCEIEDYLDVTGYV